MKEAKTQIITAVIAALATIFAAWIGKCNFNTVPEKENSQSLENTEQVISNQQNQAEKVENNQKKEITVHGDYVEGDKLETRVKELSQTKSAHKKEVMDSSKSDITRKYENTGSGNQINIEEMKGPLTFNTLEPPQPTFKLVGLENKEGLFVHKSKNHNLETEFKFQIKIEFSYSSSLSKNEIAAAFAIKTKYHINVNKKGSMFFVGGVKLML